jgi:hypothetical protein
MFPRKTVGMHAPSYSSNALCVSRMEDSPRIQPAETVQMTWCTTWYSSAEIMRNILKIDSQSENNNQNHWKTKRFMPFQEREPDLSLHCF